MSEPQTPPPALGILAGGGPLPGQVARAAAAAGRAVFIVGLEGFADRKVLAPWPHAIHRMGAAGRILADLRAHGCRDLVMIGPVRRPSFFDIRPDAEGAKMVARIGMAAFAGDDGLLKTVARVLGEEGFRVIGAQEVLTAVLAPRGLLCGGPPDARAMADIERGIAVARALGAADVGQGCVIHSGVVIAAEAVEGTDAMLDRAAPLIAALGFGRGGVLVKAVKPAQDRRVDLPAVGPETVRRAAAAGLAGIAFEAGGAILAEREACIAIARESGLFLLGFEPNTT